MSEARAILRRCDPELLDPHGDTEQLDCAEAESMVLSLMDSRRVQKVLWRQLFVLDSMLSLLEGLESAQQLMTQPCPPQPEGGARGRWKALKLESRSGVEQTENLLRSLQEKIQQVQERRDKLTLLLQRLQDKKQQCEELATPLLTAHNALQSCDSELSRLRAESEAALCHLIGWQRLRDQLQAFVSATQEVMQINLVAFNQSELSVELKPLPSDDGSTNELEPLRLTVTWENEDRFRLQVDERTVSLVEEWQTGRWSELSAALLDVMQCYVGQYELLSEIQGLRSSFAIDWQPGQRVLVYLKTAVLVCRLHVEEGYPGNGGASLLSVRRDGQPLDTTALMTHHVKPSLTEWLVYLCSSPLL